MLELKNTQRPRITFLDPSEYNLFPLFKSMCAKPGVTPQWVITQQRSSFERLRRLGVERVLFTPNEPKGLELARFIAPLKSDIIVSSTWGRADTIPSDVPKVQTFHALGNKAYFLKPEHSQKYDLLLLPSEFHRSLLIKYKIFKADDPRLKVVGWHRVDCFSNPDRFQKQRICAQFGVDPFKPTVFYAPTWSVYGPHGLFYRWFENEFDVFRKLCRRIAVLGANLIVKLHPILQKAFMENPSYWKKFLCAIEEHPHVTHVDALVDEDPQPLLFITDVLITDISSIFVDFLPLNRPVIFIEPQFDWWEQTEICSSYRPGFIVETPEELLHAVSDSFENPNRFESLRKRVFHKLVDRFDGRAAERGADEIVGLLNGGISWKRCM